MRSAVTAVHSDISKSVSLTYKRLVTKDTALVIDAVWGELAQILHGILVPFSISVLRFAEYQSITPSTIISQKERVLLNEAPESDFMTLSSICSTTFCFLLAQIQTV